VQFVENLDEFPENSGTRINSETIIPDAKLVIAVGNRTSTKLPRNPSAAPNNSEKNRGVLRLLAKIAKFCPKFAKKSSGQGINRECREFRR
jgi:hypothetical protein